MPTYNYVCSNCQHTYSELRPADTEQITKVCTVCNESEYVEQ